MRNLLAVLTIIVGVGLVLAPVGCAKKCIKPEEPIPPPPIPEPEPVIQPEAELDLQTIHFDFDKFDIRPGDADKLRGNGNQLMAAAKQGQKPMVTIEGHCDPVGTSEYNMALGQRRAESAKKFLADFGVPADQLSTVSYGEEKLVTQKEAEFEMNRRCEFRAGE